MASVTEKYPLDVEDSTVSRPSDPENASAAGEPIEVTYGVETPYRNKLFKWAFLLEEKVGTLVE